MSTSIRLPKSLLDELDSSSGNQRKGPKYHSSRKEGRKQNRLENKRRRADYFTSTHSSRQKRISTAQEHTDAPKLKKRKTEQPPSSQIQIVESKAKTPLEKLAQRSEKPVLLVTSSRSRRDHKEDDYIAYLESKLGWKKNGTKTGSYGSGLGEDGLDEFFMDIDRLETRNRDTLGVTDDGASTASEEMSSKNVDDDEGRYEKWSGFSHSLGMSDSSGKEDEVTMTESVREPPSNPVVGSRYIPPHLRETSTGDDPKQSESLIKLNKELKGLLNRLSEQNISSILDNIEEIYRNHRRNDVTSALTTLVIDGISSHSIHLDSYVVLYAAFVASLHKLIGVEFAAFFVQHVVSSYEKYLASVSPPIVASGGTDNVPGKEASNLIVLLSELYNFQVISCILIYDIIRGLLAQPQLTEFNVELLLKITKISGLQLRQDDPSALKDIIQVVHSKISDQKGSLSSRTNFMIETLINLKNNKLRKAVGGGASGSGGQEAVERLKKFISGMSRKRHVLSREPLRVTLKDLRSAETKGKWWLVGAAWNGDPLVDNRAAFEQKDVGNGKHGANEEENLIRLARKQGMNTNIRRSVFVVIMSSEDYVDACERLTQLKLTEVQQREIVRVLLHCCGNEKSYNPYYTLICQQLCRTSHSFRITLQFCMWDFLRELGESKVGGIELLRRQQDEGRLESNVGDKVIGRTKTRSMAKAYAWWIAKDCCTLAILKPIDFTILKTQTRGFLKELLLQIFISSQTSTPVIAADSESLLAISTRNRAALEEIFIKVTRIGALAIGLLYFISEAFRKELEAESGGFLRWAVEIVKETLQTGVDGAV